MSQNELENEQSFYDFKFADNYKFKAKKGLTKEIVENISKNKNEPQWLLDIRLQALKKYEELSLPCWGPNLDELDMNNISTYVQPNTDIKGSWNDLPDDIKQTFEKLGIPKAERDYLAGVGAQYDSEVVYHSIKEDMRKIGVIYTDIDTAIREYPDLVRQYFSKIVPITEHKFIALHYAVFSGGSFVYVPKGIKLDMPLQSYYRLNSPESGQFEHTLIVVDEDASLEFIEGCSAPKYSKINLHAGCVELFVKKNGYLKYSTIENWSKNMLNLNTKKAILEDNAKVDWVSGSFGSKISMLYPMSVLKGDNSKTEYTGISFAGNGQNLDTGFKVAHIGKNTASNIVSKSISKSGGIATYRSLVAVAKTAENAKCSVVCDGLMLDDVSVSDTIPVNDIRNSTTNFSHEAKVGMISEKAIFYLMSRGLSEQEARAMIVRGFASPISKQFPIEYAVEMNRLINLELEDIKNDRDK